MISDMLLIGESEDYTIVSSPSGSAVTYDDVVNGTEVQHIGAVCNDTAYAAINLYGQDNVAHDCVVDCAGAAGVYGVYCSRVGRCKVWNIRNATPVLAYGIVLAAADNEVHDCMITGLTVGIRLANGYTSLVHDNRISSCTTGILITNSGDSNVIYHNNMLGNITQINNTGTGTANVWFENYFNNHTTDVNHNGITDTVYTENGETDYKPVSVRDGWKQAGLGIAAS